MGGGNFHEHDVPSVSPLMVTTTTTTAEQKYCLRCDVPDVPTLADLTAALDVLDLELRHEMALQSSTPPCDGKVGHESVLLTFTRTIGTREDAQIQALLAAIEPGLEEPIERYRLHRRPAHNEIVNLLVERFGPDMRTARPALSGEDSGDPWRLGSRKGEAPFESLAETLSRVPRERWSYRKGKVQTEVKIESGVTLLATRFLRDGLRVFHRLEREVEPFASENRDWLRDRMGWVVFDWYVDLFGHVPEVEALRSRLAGQTKVPFLREVVHAGNFSLSDDLRIRLTGDLAVLQFMIHRASAVFPIVSTAEQLVGALRASGYTRLPAGERREPGQREDAREALEAAMRSIASDLERVSIVKVDWTPLRSKLKPFKQRGKNRK